MFSRLANGCLFIIREGSYHAGRRLAQKGQPLRAFPWLAKAAIAGHPESQFLVAQSYLKGEGVPPSRDEAARWFKAASGADHRAAQVAYAELLWSRSEQEASFPRMRRSDCEEAILWATRAAESGMPAAQGLLGRILCFGPATLCDVERGEKLLRQAVKAGEAGASLGLALLLHGRSKMDRQSLAKIKSLLTHAAESGSAHAVFVLGVLAEQAADLETAAVNYQKAATQGHVAAQARWGIFLTTGHGCLENATEGESWVRRAALAGDREAALWLGDHYANPDDLHANTFEAAAWYRRAAEGGHSIAAGKLGRMLASPGPVYNPWEACIWLRQASASGDAGATHIIRSLAEQNAAPPTALLEALGDIEAAAHQGDQAAILRLGLFHCGRNDAAAVSWLGKAAETVPAARYWLGRTLDRLATSDAERASARSWIAWAAKDGMTDAMAILGEMTLHGRGGHQNLAEAFDLFEQASAQKHLGATFALGVMLSGVDGVPPDRARAKALLIEAAQRGHAPAQKQLALFEMSAQAIDAACIPQE